MEKMALNTHLLNEEEKATTDGSTFKPISPKNVYEVIRIQEGIPLFLKDHLERFRKSAEMLHISLSLSDSEIKHRILFLIQQNKAEFINLKLIWDDQQNLLIFFQNTVYPPQRYYQTGMHTTLLKLEREDPNIKVQRAAYQERVLAEREKQQAYEVLLVDQHDFITEGSRSNLFIVKNQELYTSPSANVLLGIVRKKVFAICQEEGIVIHEQNIPVADIATIEAAFITGTGNNVLPIRTINDQLLNSAENPLVKRIMEKFDACIQEDIRQFKTA